MADITMCRTEECPRKLTCHRYTATAGELQSYFMDKAWQDCEFYWRRKSVQGGMV